MSVTEAMERLTHREFLVMATHFENEWNRPNRSDWYLMQIARQIACVLHKHPDQVKINDFQLDFAPAKPKKVPEKKKSTPAPQGVWAKLINLAAKK